MVLDYIKPPGGEVSTKFSSRHFFNNNLKNTKQMRKVIINLSNRPHSEWGDAETEAYEAYNKSNDAENSIIDFIPLKTAPDAGTSIVWGIVNTTLECVNKVWSDGAPIAAVIADIPDPVTNHRFVKSCALPCVISTFDTNGNFVSIREY